MPRGPKGEKRPADVIGAAVKVMKIATGEIEEDIDGDGKDSHHQAPYNFRPKIQVLGQTRQSR